MAPSRTLSRTLGQLGLALMNATLLLALALAITGIVLVGRIESLAADSAKAAAAAITPEFRARVDARLDSVTAALSRLDTLDDRLASAASAPTPELEALRAEVSALTGQVSELNEGLTSLRASGGGALREALRNALTDAAHTLDRPATD